VSADDQLTPGALRRATDLLDAYPAVGLAYGHALWVADGAPLPTARTKVRGWSIRPGWWWLERLYRQGENPITSPEVVMRTSVLKRVGGFDPRLPHAADMELWMRIAANADVGFLRGVDQAYYRLHRTNMRKGYGRLADLRERHAVFTTVLENYGDSVGYAADLAAAARRQLAREALWEAARAYGRQRRRNAEVLGLIALAEDLWPEGATQESLYRTMQSEKNLDPRAAALMLNHKARWWLRRRGWRYRGV
jgi:hypothetical protein